MSEQKGALELLIEAVNRNTEATLQLVALGGAASPAASDTKTTTAAGTKKTTTTKKPTETKAGPKHTKAETSEVVVTVKDKLGVDKAKELLSNHGFKKMADITEDKFDAIFDEGKAMLDAEGGEEDENADDDI